MFLSPTSQISHHHKVTNITMSPTSLSPHHQHRSSLNEMGTKIIMENGSKRTFSHRQQKRKGPMVIMMI